MAVLTQTDSRNRLLALMQAEDFHRLLPNLEPVTLAKNDPMVAADGLIEYVYFPESGLSSVVATSPEGNEIEAGIYGRDGVGPIPALMGVDHSPHRNFVQVRGAGHRMPRLALVWSMDQSPSLRNLLLRFAQVMATQTAFTALSNAIHPVEERLARWLLMCHDRCPTDEIALTHEFLSLMLAVRRPSVTTSLHVLEGNGFIRNERGYITIRNRAALEEFAADAYGKPEAEYRRLIGSMTA